MSKWIDIKDRLPEPMSYVDWRCSDGIEDFGIFNKDEFMNFDLNSVSPIVCWKYSDNNPQHQIKPNE
jgi:hypothetical protein